MEENKSVYALKKVNKPEDFCTEIKGIKGVTDASVDLEKMTLEYEIDEWSSEYDVFTQVMTIADAYGCEFDFDRDSEDNSSAEDYSDKNEKSGGKDDEEETIEDDDDEEETDESGEPDGKPRKKKRKGLSERVQRIIELSLSVACFIASLFFKDIAQLIFLAVSFAIAGYDVIYEAILKIIKKNFINEELIISLAFLGAILLGCPVEAVAAVLLYSVSAFVVKTSKESLLEKAFITEMPEKCRKVIEKDKAVKTAVEEIEVGDSVFYKKGEVCAFDGTVRSAVEVKGYDGEFRTVDENGEVFSGERFSANAVVGTSKKFGEGKYDARNQKAAKVISSLNRYQSFVATKSKIYLPVLLIVCLLLAFLPPIAFDDYSAGLARWGYTATIIAALCSSLLLCGSDVIAIIASVVSAKKRNVLPADYPAAEKLVLTDEVYVDRESVLSDGNGMKEDCRGASLELKDFGKKMVMVSSLPDKDCVEICSEQSIPEYYADKNDARKVEIMDNALKNGKAVVLSEDKLKAYGLTQENGAIIAYANEDSAYKANATVTDKKVANIPFVVKLAARTMKICKGGMIAGLIVKAVLVVLALCGVAGLWWAVLADTLVGLIACIAAFLNKWDVY